jgi:hypothetical protein
MYRYNKIKLRLEKGIEEDSLHGNKVFSFEGNFSCYFPIMKLAEKITRIVCAWEA